MNFAEMEHKVLEYRVIEYRELETNCEGFKRTMALIFCMASILRTSKSVSSDQSHKQSPITSRICKQDEYVVMSILMHHNFSSPDR